MGRTGVSYTDIERAACELQGKGIVPTVDTVRELLKTGSRSTIGPYLKRWRSKQPEADKFAGLPPELSAMVKGLYERLQETANLKIEDVEQQAEKEVAVIQQKYEAINTQNAHLEEEREALNEKLSNMQALVEQLKAGLENEKILNANYAIQIREYEKRLDDRLNYMQQLERQLDYTQITLEHYRNSILTQREEDKRAHQLAVSLLTQEINALKDQLSSEHQLGLILKQQLDTSNLEKQKLEKDWYEQRSKTMILQEHLKLKEFECDEIKKKHAHLLADYSNIEAILENKEQILEATQKENLILEEKLCSIERLSAQSEILIQSLQNERLLLIQENFSLKSKSKKMIKRKNHIKDPIL